MACEIIVKIKDKYRSVQEKTVCYDDKLIADITYPKIDQLIQKANEKFGKSEFATKLTVNIRLME